MLAGQHHHRPAELATSRHLPTSQHSHRTRTSPEPLHRSQHPLVRGHAAPRAVPTSQALTDGRAWQRVHKRRQGGTVWGSERPRTRAHNRDGDTSGPWAVPPAVRSQTPAAALVPGGRVMTGMSFSSVILLACISSFGRAGFRSLKTIAGLVLCK